jgi:3-(3-hydroxy-phenyl)propionate hydroxylase/6-hydroxy-3-succinoylpyridine 3-monooxygenase
MDRHDIAIIGAGPTGALLALGMAQRGRDVILLEAEPEVVASPRAMVYFWHLLDGLDRLGVLEDIDNAGFRNSRFRNRVLETGYQADISLDPIAAVSPYAYNIHLGQDEVVRVALDHLAKFGNAEVRLGSRAVSVSDTAQGVTVSVDGADGHVEIGADWVIAADGARSAVRESLGIRFDGTTWPDRFVATNIRYPFGELGDLGDANLLLDPQNGCVIARIDKTGLYRWTWGEPADLPEQGVEKRLPSRLAALGFGDADYEIAGWTSYRMHQRSADRMRAGHVVLVGDAAHATNPTGGLGLTCGIYDLLSLIEPLDSVIAGHADATILDSWAEGRLRIFREMVSPMASGMKRMVYDEPDLAKREGFVQHGADDSDPEAQLARMTSVTALNTGVPRHHGELL